MAAMLLSILRALLPVHPSLQQDPDFKFVCPADHNKYCICRRGGDAYGGFMVQCDACEEWFHGKCVGVSKYDTLAPRYK